MKAVKQLRPGLHYITRRCSSGIGATKNNASGLYRYIPKQKRTDKAGKSSPAFLQATVLVWYLGTDRSFDELTAPF